MHTHKNNLATTNPVAVLLLLSSFYLLFFYLSFLLLFFLLFFCFSLAFLYLLSESASTELRQLGGRR